MSEQKPTPTTETISDNKDAQAASAATVDDTTTQENANAEETCINYNQKLEAQNIVKNHIMMSATTGFVPLPLVDIAALTTLQLHMLQSLSDHFNVEFEKKSAKSLLTALMTGALPVLGVTGIASLTKIIPGIGTLGGGAILSVASGTTIYATGQVFIEHFSQGGTLQDLNTQHARQVFKQEYAQGKVFVKDLIGKKNTKVDGQAVKNAA